MKSPVRRPEVATPSLRHWWLVHLAARLGSVSAVARAVHLSQPAVTQALLRVERALGVPLFDRLGSGLRMRAEARRILDRVEGGLAQMQEALALQRARPGGARLAPGDPFRGISNAQLDALAAVIEHESYAVAARHLGLTRAALYRAVHQLERRLSVTLLERNGQRLRPSAEAQRCVVPSRLARAEFAQARVEAAAAVGREVGTMVIGAMPLARSVIVPEAVLCHLSARPQHAVEILDGTYEALLLALRHGSCDVLVGALRESSLHEEVVQEHLFDDPLAIGMRADHPLAKAGELELRALGRYPWIAPRAQSPLRRHFDALHERIEHRTSTSVIQCNTMDAARALLRSSDRLMLLSEQQIYHERLSGQLVARAHPFGRVVRPIGLTLRRAWQPTAAQQHFLQVLRQTARALAAGLPAGRFS